MTDQEKTRESAPERRRWLDDRKNVDKIYRALLVACGGLMLADLFYDKHAKYMAEDWFGFYGFYGFAGCVFLVLAAKQLRRLLMRPEDYYDH